jgi:TonB family protein
MNGKTRKAALRCVHTAILIVISCLPGGARAADEPPAPQAAAEPVELEVFKGPSIRRSPGIRYPASEERNGNEGWVVLSMMIDPQGKPYEVTVADSTGNEAFEKAALSAVDRFSFEPATHEGKPIDSGFRFKVLFHMFEPATGASSKFVSGYKTLTKAIEAEDRARADETLANLQARNLYEEAYWNFGKYFYDVKWGTEVEQLADLRKAVAGESSPRYLPKDAFIAALTSMLRLELESQDYGSALMTWKRLQPIARKATLDPWREVMDRVSALRNDDRLVRLSGEISKGTSWNGTLFKKRFEVKVESGHVAEIKLRCETQYLFFRHEPGVIYRVETRAGDCGIELVGDPGTKFHLDQS